MRLSRDALSCKTLLIPIQTPRGPDTRGVDSWSDDTDRHVGPNLPLSLLILVVCKRQFQHIL